MRGLHASFLVAVGLAAACATSTPVHETTGQGGATTGAGWLVGTTGSGSRACGVNSSDPDCAACVNARCCDEGKACGDDPNCLSCVSKVVEPNVCESNQELTAFNLCLQASCAEACLGGSGPSSSTAGVGGAPTTSSSTASSSVAGSSSTAASSGGASSAASSSAASSSSTASSSSAASSSSSSGGAPTCSSVDGNVGCCDAAGLLYYCSDGQTVVQQTCTGGDVCGWTAVFGYYDCVPPPGGVDPGGTYPLACGG